MNIIIETFSWLGRLSVRTSSWGASLLSCVEASLIPGCHLSVRHYNNQHHQITYDTHAQPSRIQEGFTFGPEHNSKRLGALRSMHSAAFDPLG